MSEAKRCPNCGYVPPHASEASQPEDFAADSAPISDLEARLKPLDPAQPDVPPIPLLATGSSDDSFMDVPLSQRLAAAEPDLALGAFDTPLESPRIDSNRQPSSTKIRAGSSTNFPALNIEGPRSTSLKSAKVPTGVGDSSDDVEGEPEERRLSWSFVLLMSYASAITLALVWTFINNRSRAKPEVSPLEEKPAVAYAPNPARQGGLSRKVDPPEPILGEHFATFGQPLKVGSLEITPIDVKRQDIQLQRTNTYASPARREGGKKALVLRLKLRNMTSDTIFSPLDQGYLRERGKDIVDTYVETADKQRVYPFPLALDSEWSIVGQDFTELRPGESRTVVIATVPDAPPDSAGPFTWRVRLRTGINRTELIGVRWPEKSSISKGK